MEGERRELTTWNGSTGKNGEKKNKTLGTEMRENIDTLYINKIFN